MKQQSKQVQVTYLENVLNILFIHWYNSLEKSMNNINILCNISTYTFLH